MTKTHEVLEATLDRCASKVRLSTRKLSCMSNGVATLRY